MVAVGQQGVPPHTAATVMSRFNSFYPHWTSSCDQAPGDGCLRETDSAAAAAAIQEKQTGNAQAWLDNAETTWGGNPGDPWPWPWTTADMSTLALVATALAA
jgi:hypothetical protein